MASLAQDIDDLKTQLRDHPDVMEDERIRIVANAWIVRVLFLVVTVLAFPFAFFVAGWLMMWIDGGRDVAALCGLLGAVSAALGPVGVHQIGYRLERRYLRRVLKLSSEREVQRLAAHSGASSVAIPTSTFER